MPEKKMTNIRLDPALWLRVKAAAGEHGTTLERWVSDALEARLAPARSSRRAAPAPGAAADRVAPADEAAEAQDGDLQALHWRVEALEATVDYLAGIVGAGFPRGRSAVAEAAAGNGPSLAGEVAASPAVPGVAPTSSLHADER